MMFGNIKSYIRLLKDFNYAGQENSRHPERFNTVRIYCMFIGYPRSSHSLIGSLLDAHPDAIIAHEQDVLKYIKYRFKRNQIFQLLVKNSQDFTLDGRTWTGYSYAVSDQYQGTYRILKVIGDKKGANSTRRISRNPKMLQRLRQTIGLPVHMIHVLRNPYDNISTMAFRNNGSKTEKVTEEVLRGEMDNYFNLVRTVSDVRKSLGDECTIDIRIEDFMSDPRGNLEKICFFLELDPEKKYLDDCAGIVFQKAQKTRKDFPWSDRLIAEVKARMDKYEFMTGYGFDD